MPAMLMMPMAALWGMDTNQNMWSLFIGALDAALAWRLLRQVSPEHQRATYG